MQARNRSSTRIHSDLVNDRIYISGREGVSLGQSSDGSAGIGAGVDELVEILPESSLRIWQSTNFFRVEGRNDERVFTSRHCLETQVL